MILLGGGSGVAQLTGDWHAEAKAFPGGRAHFADAYGAFSPIVRWFPVR
jgi:hypothetical protein